MKYLIKRTLFTLLYYLFRIFPIKSNKVFVSNYYGKGYGDIPKYIVNDLLNENDKYDIVWVVKDYSYSSNLPEKVRIVKRNTIKYIYEQVTAKYWIDNCRKQFYERKRKHQTYIQTWHGGLMIKKVEKSVEDRLPKEYVLGAKNDSKMADILVSNNRFLTSIYKKDFWYDGKIIECGSPRNDIIYNNDKNAIKKVYDYFQLSENVQICLYAPTFRSNFSLTAYNIDFEKLKKSLEKRFGGNWKILVRLHPNISDKSEELIKYNDYIINASKYDDIQELLVAANFMITDYSSCIFDYGITYKNCIIYASDIDEYRKDRGFYLDIDDFPFTITNNNEELNKEILKFDEKSNKSKLKDFYSKVGLFEDGKGAKTVANIIRNNSDDGKIKKEDKVLFFNTVMLYIMMASTFIFPLLTFPYLTRVLGTENYGVVVLSNAVMQYFQLLIDFGFILSGTAICSKERNNKEKLQRIVSSIVYGKLLLSLIGLIIVIIISFALNLFEGKELFIICSYIPLILTSFVPDYLFRGIEKMGIITFRTIVSKFVYTFLIFLLVKQPTSYFYIPFSLFVSNLIIVIWSWSYIVKKLNIRLIVVKFNEIIHHLKESSTFFASRIATTVYSASNIFVLGLYGYNDTELGIYGASNTLINYGKSMFSPIADSLYPYMVKNKNYKLVKKIICVLVPAIIVGCIVLFFISDLFITIMCGKDYLDTVPIFKRMIPILIITLPSYLYGFPMLGSINKNDKANLSVFMGAGFHFVGLVLLYFSNNLSFYNIVYLTTATELLIMIVRIYFFNKYKKIEFIKEAKK